jgi:hypothetical protein
MPNLGWIFGDTSGNGYVKSERKSGRSAVYDQMCTVEEGRLAANNKRNQLGEFSRVAKTLHWNIAGNDAFGILAQFAIGHLFSNPLLNTPGRKVAWGNYIHSDIICCQIAREGLCQAHDTKSHDRREQQMVGRLSHAGRAEEDDITATSSTHHGNCHARQSHGTHQQQFKRTVPVFVAQVFDAAIGYVSGIHYQNVETAQCGDRVLYQSSHITWNRQIRGYTYGFKSTIMLDGVAGTAQRSAVTGGNRHVASFGCKSRRARKPETSAGRCNQGKFASESHIAPSIH